jgi:ribosomal-protein-alanine N-acetyltransferase
MMILETPRLLIRLFQPTDDHDLFLLLSDPDVMQYSLKGPYSQAMSNQFLNDTIKSYQERPFGIYAVILKNEQTFIGFCGFFPQHIDNKAEVELGYRLLKKYWQQGYATEAASACKDYAVNQLHLKKLVSIIEPNNMASRRVSEKIGFTLEQKTQFHQIPVLIYSYEAHKPS